MDTPGATMMKAAPQDSNPAIKAPPAAPPSSPPVLWLWDDDVWLF